MMIMRNQKGMALGELMMTAGIGLVVLGASASMVVNQSLSIEDLKDNLEINSIQTDIQRALLDPKICLANFGGAFVIDESRIGQAAYSVPLPKIVGDATGTSALLTAGQAVNGLASRLDVRSISAVDFRIINSKGLKFNLNATFVKPDGRVVGVMRVMSIRVQTDPASPANAKTVSACGGPVSTPLACRRVQQDGPGISLASAQCASDEYLRGGGGLCLDPSGNPASQSGFLYISRPTYSAGIMGWEADCFNVPGNNNVRARAYAYCCKQ